MAPSKPTTTTFGRRLKKWRTERHMKQTELEAEVECASGWISKLERGNIRTPPDRTACTRLALALGMDPDEVWEAAVEERLREFDTDIHEWMQERLTDAAGFKLTQTELDLIKELRELDGDEQGDMPWSEVFGDLALFLGAQSDKHKAAMKEKRKPKLVETSPRPFLEALAAVTELPADLEVHAMRAATQAYWAIVAAYRRGTAERSGGRP